MATTTNYNWTTPDDTDLVKDGAAAIRTLGSSADTTVKALNPGTTAGDIDYYTTSTAKARVGIGTAGQVLQVNSGATAPEWAAPSAGALSKITSGSFTEVASATVDDCFSATYKNYMVILNVFSVNSNSIDLFWQYRYSTNTQAATYNNSAFGYTSANALTGYGASSANSLELIQKVGEPAADVSIMNLLIQNIGTDTKPYLFGTGADGEDAINQLRIASKQTTARTYTGFILTPSVNTISGSYVVYGLEN
jgi:hypothetical protein